MLDISERRAAEQKLEELHKQLIGASRQAGMAEVATGVLHNVGNVLNSVNVSASLLQDRTLHSKSINLTKLAALIAEHSTDMASFLTTNPKGKVLPSYVVSLSGMLEEEREQALSELILLTKNVQHIKDIVAMQQSYAKVSGMIETLGVAELVEDAIQMNEGGFSRHAIQVTRRFTPVPPVAVDKHKALQILVNLLRNAKHSLQECGRQERCLCIDITADETRHVNITITDNGLGIPAENLTRIFSHGFTTKRQGHGFGLHSGALAAKEMKGSLAAASEGLGQGASFTLSLPIAEQKAAA
jgi:signal transduction histidine kinase